MRTEETFHPSHGIHVNPKYLEARRQLENPVTDNRHSREASSEIQFFGHNSFPKYNDHDLDHLGFRPPSLRMVREGSPQTLTPHGSSMVGHEGLFLRASPRRIGLKRSTSPQGQRLQRSSPRRMIETASRSQSGLEFQSHKASESNGWFGRSLAVDDGVPQLAASTTSNRCGRQRQRELIDAYGDYRCENFLRESFLKIQRADVNGVKGKAGKMDWQNSEEEEYVWEDMSPTLADPGKRSNTLFEQSAENFDFRRRNWLKDSTDERNAIRDYGHESMNKMLPDDTGSSSEHFGHLEHSSLPFQSPYSVGVTPSIIRKQHGLYDNSHNTEVPFFKLYSTSPESLNAEMPTLEKAHKSSLPPLTWLPPHKSQSLPLLPTPNLQLDNHKRIGNQKPDLFVPLSQPQFGANGRCLLTRSFQETHGGFNPPLLTQPPNGVQNILDSSLHGRTSMPPLPPGPPPLLSQPLPTSQNGFSATSRPVVSGFSGLIGSLMAQGLISLKPTDQVQNTLGLEFNAELLKIRHESAINAMYAELPRQCTTCGIRFTSQDDHSNHMDWHVTKNRISKNRKQKPSRKWFVSAKEWLCGAEALGADTVPGFSPTEAVPEKKEETKMTVPADENQTSCALCGEPFEDFYSDETEEWMYRGAVYLNAPNGEIKALEGSQLGPIVHVKCRSESVEDSLHV